MTSRLASIAPDLAHRLASSTPIVQRRVAVAAARYACATAGLEDQAVEDLFRAVEQGETGDTARREVVQRLADDFDDAAWAVRDAADAGRWTDPDRSSEEVYLTEFIRSRAATAASDAAGADPLIAALDAVYEASITADDVPADPGPATVTASCRAAIEAAFA